MLTVRPVPEFLLVDPLHRRIYGGACHARRGFVEFEETEFISSIRRRTGLFFLKELFQFATTFRGGG